MYRRIIIFCLFLTACSRQHDGLLFDRKYDSPCDAFNDISHYALGNHINKTPQQFQDLRIESSKNLAASLNTDPVSSGIEKCEDIEIYANSQSKKNKMQVYSDALYYFMQSMDPHSMYIPEANADDMKKQDKNIAYGVGFEPKYVHRAIKNALPIDTILLDYVYPDTPAYGKLQPEDEIESIDGMPINGKLFSDVKKLIDSNPKSIQIKVKRLEEPVTFAQTEFEKPALYSRTIEKNGSHFEWIRIPRFVEGLSKQLREKLISLNKEENEGLILDLRGNPGGLVDEGVSVLKFFLTKGGEVFHTEGSTKKNTGLSHRVYKVDGNALYKKPIVVLVDSDTASIAEAVAGSLQKQHRAEISGNKSFGKGSVQIDQNISTKNGFGGRLVTTVSLVYYPDEDTHQIKRISPNHEFFDEKFVQAIELVKQKNPTSIFYEKEYVNSIQPHGSSASEISSDLEPAGILNSGNLNQDLSHTCDHVAYQACLETYAVRFLEILNHKNPT